MQTLRNQGCDVSTLTFSRTSFFGGASASATSNVVTIDTYKNVTTLIATTTPSANTVSAAGLVITYNPEVSSDGGTTWVALAEINGTAVTPPAHNPTTTGVARAYIYPATAPFFRVRISGAGAAGTGVSAACFLSLQP